MRWTIPAKTFLVGEYIALIGGPAIVVTTTPCFEVSLTTSGLLQGIHRDSLAGRWWLTHAVPSAGIQWHDPYHGLGGMGASSAEFLGVYSAIASLKDQTVTIEGVLAAYLQMASSNLGSSPSGYDVMAQYFDGCVYIDRQAALYQSYGWSFHDLAFILLHTGKKLATHHHLQALKSLSSMGTLAAIVGLAKEALETSHDALMIEAVQEYHRALLEMDLVAKHSIHLMESLQKEAGILAMKGCGAMGADVLLVLVTKCSLAEQVSHLSSRGYNVVATSEHIYDGHHGDV